jgi:transketolase
MKKYGLDASALVSAIEGLLGMKLAIGEEELAEVRLDHVHSAQKAEAL